MSVVPATTTLLSVEFKINLLSPADGDLLIAHGKVVKAGKSISVASTEVFIVKHGKKKLCATGVVTLMSISRWNECWFEQIWKVRAIPLEWNHWVIIINTRNSKFIQVCCNFVDNNISVWQEYCSYLCFTRNEWRGTRIKGKDLVVLLVKR